MILYTRWRFKYCEKIKKIKGKYFTLAGKLFANERKRFAVEGKHFNLAGNLLPKREMFFHIEGKHFNLAGKTVCQ